MKTIEIESCAKCPLAFSGAQLLCCRVVPARFIKHGDEGEIPEWCPLPDSAHPPAQAEGEKCACGGAWITDGRHSDKFCEKCFESR